MSREMTKTKSRRGPLDQSVTTTGRMTHLIYVQGGRTSERFYLLIVKIEDKGVMHKGPGHLEQALLAAGQNWMSEIKRDGINLNNKRD